jgi:hypothetical protein
MATMYPPHLKTDSDLDAAGLTPISAAERKLFDVFKKHLPDEFTVFHGVLLQVPSRMGGVSDREIDFLVAHPEYGLLTIEVKGGLIQIDGRTGEWASRDRYGEVHAIKNPFEQIRQASYDLHSLLREEKSLASFDYSTWYAVALPDIDVDEDLGLGARRRMVLDRRDIQPRRIEHALTAIFEYYQRSGRKPPGAKGVRAMTRKIAPSWFLTSHMATEFEEEEEKFLQLTRQQHAVLEFITDKPRALIAGCAGSGKTTLAVEKARRLASEGKRVLFTCYNKKLAEWLSDTFKIEGVEFQHFHSLAVQIPKEIGTPIPWYTDLGVSPDEYWSRVVPEKLFDAADNLPADRKFDGIVVDEGQDFKSTYWEPLQMLLKDPDHGHLYIFYDDSQRLYSEDKFPLPEPAGRLNRNLRSTYEIGEQVVKYYEGIGQVFPGGPQTGRAVEIVDPGRYESPEQALADILGMLEDEQVSLSDIVILSPLSDGKSCWSHRMDIGDYVLHRTGKIKGKRVRLSTIHSFKGLESKVVILTELEHLDDDADRRQLLYVALSRARHHLIVLGILPDPA